ncbi:unnamed protein product [Prunus armeniaca]
MISGGTPIADSSRRSVKSYVRAVWHPQVLSLNEERSSKIRRLGWEPITFSEEEEKGIIFPHSNPMIIRADIADFNVGRILIDTRSSVNVLFADAFNGLRIDHQNLNKEITPLLSFSGDVVEPIGSLQLPLNIGSGPRRAFIHLLIPAPAFRRPDPPPVSGNSHETGGAGQFLTELPSVRSPSSGHQIGRVRSGTEERTTCGLIPQKGYAGSLQLSGFDPDSKVEIGSGRFISSTLTSWSRSSSRGPTGRADMLRVIYGGIGNPDVRAVTRPSMPNAQATGMTTSLRKLNLPKSSKRSPSPTHKIGRFESALPSVRIFITFIRDNSEVFAWSYNDMPGISLDVISHKLSISPSFKPVQQKRRSYDAERYEAMKTEVDKLQAIVFIRDVTYPIWLANSVLVKKFGGAWRMCQDYTDLN